MSIESLRCVVLSDLECKLNETTSGLKKWLLNFAKQNNCISDLAELNSPKYYIGYIENELQVCCTYIGINGNVVYFANRKVAQKALNTYRTVLTTIVEMKFMQSRLCDKTITEDEINNISTIIDKM